ncbi:S8 family serine peptidase [Uliginosibacterium paludis]|uniref:S8 family serine peptidase n=1 Tax=Uliginosibacterium paludis TaxID=1615952 RepID=A0ABV2CS54_9RHOO
MASTHARTRPPVRKPAVLLLALILPAGAASAATYAPWLRQIGVSDTVMSAANWGTGQMLGVVDTGINPTHPVFASGQVSQALSSCAAVSFRCSNGFRDDNSHGTAVAEIAAGNAKFAWTTSYGGYTTTAGSVISVAPNANILAEKVLNAAGSGYSTDVANGVRKAADAGAMVINVSITYGNTADIVSAINYATSKGAVIVWAGGNSNVALLNGANTTGLTAQAISRLVFAGSVSPTNTKSSFSNTPGSGKLVNTAGQATNYSARWLVAPGEAILAPYTTAGTSAWSYWSGTSMAAPVVSGSLLLVQSAWPILRTRGTAIDLLLATSTDLGAAGADGTYGMGLVNLAKAFQPVGTLTVTRANGSTIAVSSLTGALITGGALGSLSAVQASLANYTALDSYARNFSVNLAGLIRSPSTAASLNALPSNVNTGPRRVTLADGRELAYWQSGVDRAADHRGEFGFNEERVNFRQQGFALLADPRSGNTLAFGQGYPAQYAWTRALTEDAGLALLAHDAASPGLVSLAQGGSLVAAGMRLNERTRFALSWSSTASPAGDVANAWNMPEGRSLRAGLDYRLNRFLDAGVIVSTLSEPHGLLGSTYDRSSAISLGRNESLGYGASLGLRLNERRRMLLEGGVVSTRSNQSSGMFAGTDTLRSTHWSLSYQEQELWRKGDRLSFGISQPLRVSSGRIGVVSTQIAEDGEPFQQTDWVSLAPTGRELDHRIGYRMPASHQSELLLQASYRQDAGNLRGHDDAGVSARWNTRF